MPKEMGVATSFKSPHSNVFIFYVSIAVCVCAMIFSAIKFDFVNSIQNVNFHKSKALVDQDGCVRINLVVAGHRSDPNGTRNITVSFNESVFLKWSRGKGRLFDLTTGKQVSNWSEIKGAGVDDTISYAADLGNVALPELSLDKGAAPGVPFIWPPVYFGHLYELSEMEQPRGMPIVLETLSTSPKVFYVHNFLSDVEADALVSFAQAFIPTVFI